MSIKQAKWRIEQRQKEAQERQEERAKRTPQDQLNRLDQMFGKDIGAVKERARLKKLIDEES